MRFHADGKEPIPISGIHDDAFRLGPQLDKISITLIPALDLGVVECSSIGVQKGYPIGIFRKSSWAMQERHEVNIIGRSSSAALAIFNEAPSDPLKTL